MLLSKLGVLLQIIIVILLAIVIALIIYYGTNPAKPAKAPTHRSSPAFRSRTSGRSVAVSWPMYTRAG